MAKGKDLNHKKLEIIYLLNLWGHTNNTEAVRAKISQTLKGTTQPVVVCPHCDKQGGNAMKRWHFGNCKTLSKFYTADLGQ